MSDSIVSSQSNSFVLQNRERIQSIVQLLPKIDIHTHLGGCIRSSTIYDLIKLHPNIYENPDEVVRQVQLTEGDQRNLKQCFDIFKIINSVTADLKVVERITYETLEDYDAENCIYLELRTTPKANSNPSYTKKDYLMCILNTIERYFKEHENDTNFVDVSLLVSVNRSESIEKAKENIDLAHELISERRELQKKGHVFRSSGVVGLDFCGNPYDGNFTAFAKLFAESNLNQTIHFAEINNYEESKAMLRHCLEMNSKVKLRLGHAVCLNDEIKEMLVVDKSKEELREKHTQFDRIPVEICLTSNLLSKSVFNIHDHPLVMFYLSNHPVSINTDDRGVFQTSLEIEYMKAIEVFDKILSNTPNNQTEIQTSLYELIRVVEKSIESIFVEDSVIEKILISYRERVALVLAAD
ncbi:hypothetical protein C9374_006871 [Naegleria lovaniensis]|uniref:Adenosine deaminase domain-containing protein n=1 Tax=Naegleria lovaniensis TaxID=51637 RepID=A0AA88KXN0_NAELO|nr:uncharacterized protein C9374_006871 [Naegleria lovaniensis]KAG2393340.1 hypothetical protein C9374_006871 [Naegleria lovaniensis]